MNKIRFQIVPPVDRPDEPVFVTGSHPALGDWEPARGLRLRWEPPFQVGEFDAETGVHFEYKVTRGHWESEAVDAYGNVRPNDSHEVWLGHTIHHTLADWKDRYCGRLTRERVHSRGLAGWRDLLVWLPPSYGVDGNRRFPVMIFHDGDNVFDPATSAVTGVDIAADEWVSLLSRAGVLSESIVVGICHPEGFSEENNTLRDFDLSPELGGAGYANFVATELIAHIDAHYRTLATPESRILAGVSLGALNNVFTAFRHPGVFGKFVCLSTAFEDILEAPPEHSVQLKALANLPALPSGVKMYFDYGTLGLDECYEPYHRDLGSLLREKGWKDGQQFQISRIPGGTHDEVSWRSRLGEGLRFVAGKVA
jgi:enterochelin esterase-like enzyme